MAEYRFFLCWYTICAGFYSGACAIMALDYCLMYRLVVIIEDKRFHKRFVTKASYVAFFALGVLLGSSITAFLYGCMDASDDWQQLPDIPLEVRIDLPISTIFVLRVEVVAMFPSLLSQRLFLSQYSTPSSPIHFVPNTAKTNDHGGNEEFSYGMASMQGWRDAMEDACTVRLQVADTPPFDEWSFFAVFDGHNGDCLAELAAQRLLDSIMKTPKFVKLADRLKRNHGQMDEKCLRRIRKGICNGFLTFDAEAREKCNNLEPSGTAVLCAFVTPTLIVLANCGDSRGILSRQASPMLVTTDHTPMDAGEYERIRKAGGAIWHERINGSIALSRSLGDYCYKTDSKLSATEQLVSPEPDVHIVERQKFDDEFIILACDGIYDVFGDEELVSLVRSRLAVADDLVAVTNQVLDMALAQGSRDNMTLLLVAFDAAPKLSASAVEREQKFCCELEAKIK
ncbi:phosphatase 2C containing protein, partial [Aphelenchoides avenae]